MSEQLQKFVERYALALQAYVAGAAEATLERAYHIGRAAIGEGLGVLDLAGAHADLTPEELRERILREVHAFTGDAPQHDDMTMVILKIEDL